MTESRTFEEFFSLMIKSGWFRDESDDSDIPQEIKDYTQKRLEELGLKPNKIMLVSTPNSTNSFWRMSQNE